MANRDTPTPPGAATPRIARDVVGRQRELAALEARLAAMLTGQPGVLLLAGEPGIGKTRLLAALAARAASARAIVLRGGASDAEGMPPYLPFLEALGGYVEAANPKSLREGIGEHAASLVTILPEIRTRLGDLPPSYPLPPEQARLRLFEAVGTLLAAIADAAPLLLIFDDLHWADGATLDLLGHVARRAPTDRLLVAGAYRPADADANVAFGRTVTELNRLRALTTVRIDRLTAEETATLAAGFLGLPLDAAAAQLLFAQSEGNPFFAEELLRHWGDLGALVACVATWKLDRDLALVPPPTVVDAIRQRLARLPPATLDHLRTAAIVGRSFELALVADVAGQDEERVEGDLQPAVRAEMLRAEIGEVFVFAHDKIRECLYAEVSAVRRRRLHGYIGRALEARAAAGEPGLLPALAFHFAGSGDRERGADYAGRAADEALAAHAWSQAADLYRTATRLLNADHPRRGRLLLGSGEAALHAGAVEEAIAAFAEAQSRFAASGDARASARAALGRGRALWRMERLQDALAAFTAALDLIGDRVVPETVETLVELCNLLTLGLGFPDEGQRYGDRALSLAGVLGDARLEAAANRTVGILLVRDHHLAAGRELLERALTFAIAADDPVEAAECCSCLTMARYWSAEFRGFGDAALAQVAHAERCQDLFQLRHVYCYLAAWSVVTGRRDDGERWLDRARDVVARLGMPEPAALIAATEGLIALHLGDAARAEPAVRAAVDAYRAFEPSGAAWHLGLLALAQPGVGQAEAALATADEIIAILTSQPPARMALPESLTPLALAVAALGERQRAARIYPLLLPFAGGFGNFLVDRALGALAALLGDRAAAAHHLSAAEAIARYEGMSPEIGRILAARSDLELGGSDPDAPSRAAALLAEALTIFEAIGWRHDAEAIRERLRSLRQPPAVDVERATFPAGLSAREVEVLRLAARGLSNREIAVALFISQKTVANHLTAVFAKAGVEKRVGATGFAIRHGLIDA